MVTKRVTKLPVAARACYNDGTFLTYAKGQVVMQIKQFFIDGLGCESYLVSSEAEGVAAVVDPDRDVALYLEEAGVRGLTITHIIETHLHADHVSGNTDLAARTGAAVYVHEAVKAGFAHQALKHGDVLTLGEVRIEVLATPGHTPDSVSLLLTDTTKPEPPMLLSGDTLFVGDVGRPDLVGADAAREMAGHLHDSLFQKVLTLDDATLVYPGHGAGSLCGRSLSAERSTILGVERETNPALKFTDKDAFIADLTTNLPEQPGNHRAIKQINRAGPTPLGEIAPSPLRMQDAIAALQRGAALLDTRPKDQYAALHVPGGVYLPANDQLSNRIGLLLPPEARIVLIVEDEAAYRRVVLSLARVGYENVAGYIDGGIEAWESNGLPTVQGDVEDITAAQLHDMMSNGAGENLLVLDVREPWEYAQARVPAARLMPLGSLAAQIATLDPEQPVALICASGSRSLSAAALLGKQGFKKMYNVVGGTDAWRRAGYPTERG